eukprot:TRINITY_DN72336_c0_g1_i1.p1 TRINITY_DN72336_c0_g1~~TRINITY_DN72336_c0_g1_i1.p1  ORF type:complete len:323 (-),score=45.85 TRINITY_DN72336_c0_g1_i1:79-1047(-)
MVACRHRGRRIATYFFVFGVFFCCLWSQFALVWNHGGPPRPHSVLGLDRGADSLTVKPSSSVGFLLPALDVREFGVWLLWSVVGAVGSRHVTAAVPQVLPQYEDTVFEYAASEYPAVAGLVALTIDDGICRQADASRSMLTEVLALLRNHSAHATFFLSSEYVRPGDLERLTAAGHEVANHLPKDKSYADYSATAFEAAFLETQRMLKPHLDPHGRRWFRAPQGRLTEAMVGVLRAWNVTHVLGDCYADDWMLEKSGAEVVASLYLRQVSPGSIMITHMPERGFREHTLESLKLILAGLAEQNLRAVTLRDLDRIARSGMAG